jgi:tetratricopeptide (TPR) repeat protein
MAYTSEIDKLERRWKENPQGTAFAPLAEVYRKDGQLDRARDVLRQGLENNPDHIPGNIVLGRCCLDMREDGAAETAFSHVLELDAENVIALKALGDITERQGRLAEASQWLTRLMQVDPTNDEAREQLTRVEGVQRQAALVMPAEDAQVPVESAEPEPLEEPVPEAPVVAAAPAPEPMVEPKPALSSVWEDEDTLVVEAISQTAPTLESIPSFEPFEESDLRPRDTVDAIGEERMSGLEAAGLDLSGMAESVATPSLPDVEPDAEFAPPADLGIEVLAAEEAAQIDIRAAASSEFQPTDHADELLEVRGGASSEFQVPDASTELTLSASPSNEFQSPSGSEELIGTSGAGGHEFQSVHDPAQDLAGAGSFGVEYAMPDPPPDVPAVDEVMPDVVIPDVAAAEDVEEVVYVSEEEVATEPRDKLALIFPGDAEVPHPPRRISQPEELASETPAGEPEPVLTESMAEMYARQGLNDQALHVYRGLAARAPGDQRLQVRIRELQALTTTGGEQVTARWPAYAASVTGGESVESFFHALASARPAPLGSSGGSFETVSQPEAMPVTNDQSPGAPTRPASDPLSLSAIFGEDAAPPPPATPPAPASASTPTSGHAFSFDQFFGGKNAGGSGSQPPSIHTSQPSGLEEDLDQFQNWLKSLKK